MRAYVRTCRLIAQKLNGGWCAAVEAHAKWKNRRSTTVGGPFVVRLGSWHRIHCVSYKVGFIALLIIFSSRQGWPCLACLGLRGPCLLTAKNRLTRLLSKEGKEGSQGRPPEPASSLSPRCLCACDPGAAVPSVGGRIGDGVSPPQSPSLRAGNPSTHTNMSDRIAVLDHGSSTIKAGHVVRSVRTPRPFTRLRTRASDRDRGDLRADAFRDAALEHHQCGCRPATARDAFDGSKEGAVTKRHERGC